MAARSALFALSIGLLACLLPAAPVHAQGEKLTMPTDNSLWLNGGPISAEQLKGKAAVLYFYEEQCPRCRERWSMWQSVAKKMEQKPIVFIAVNSGNSREAVAKYMQDVKVTWPVIVDTTRAYEKTAGLPQEISLQNIMQIRMIKADGGIQYIGFDNPEPDIEKGLAGAAWSSDPAGIPAPLFPLWKNLEFGMAPGPLGSVLRTSLASPDPATKAAADKIKERVHAKIAEDMQAAKAMFAGGEKWKSYKMVDGLAATYAGIDLPESVAKAKAGLAADETVKKELTAQRELDALKKRAATASPAAKKVLVQKLKEIPKTYAGTDAAAEAEKLIAEIPPGAGR